MKHLQYFSLFDKYIQLFSTVCKCLRSFNNRLQLFFYCYASGHGFVTIVNYIFSLFYNCLQLLFTALQLFTIVVQAFTTVIHCFASVNYIFH